MAASFQDFEPLSPSDTFVHRHIGPSDAEIRGMLSTLSCGSLDQLIDHTVPATIRMKAPLRLDPPRGESETLSRLRAIAQKNRVLRSYIGMGYYDTITPPVILRNVLENPGWYTQYTPYQAEISQGRLEALINFQTMVADLTSLPIANASLLDEATAAAEAMHMAHALSDGSRNKFLVAKRCHPQTIAVVQTRARPLGIEVVIDCPRESDYSKGDFFGVLLQYPNTFGNVNDYSEAVARMHAGGAKVIVAADLLALTLLKPPGEWGADIVIGSAQRLGVPLGFGGPHAAFLACRDEFKRQIPGRLIGVSKDARGHTAYRLSLATREQHIRREKATSNICTAQVLLAVMASMYAVYHGPKGLRRIAERVHGFTRILANGMRWLGHEVLTTAYFDTIRVRPVIGEHCKNDAAGVLNAGIERGLNLRDYGDGTLGVSLDETTTLDDVKQVLASFGCGRGFEIDPTAPIPSDPEVIPAALRRETAYLTHPVFNQYHSEHEMLRYLNRLQAKDLSLTTSMIPLGSCTMKLNGTSEMIPVTWPEFGRMHPFAPADQTRGYQELCYTLESWLAEITGFAAVSLQPNSGAQGEYAGLLTIRAYHESRGDSRRNICLIPVSAHGTNPASAVMAGFKVVPVACDDLGNINIEDLSVKAEQHRANLAALMVTYPSTHGVFEEGIREICEIVHRYGGQVYMDGANMNAQVGLTRPANIGADVCHLNLHKTFCIPHGGGGPGMGPIGVAAHLAPFLSGHPVVDPGLRRFEGGDQGTNSTAGAANAAGNSAGHEAAPLSPYHLITLSPSASRVGPVSAAPYGSASILTISWMYIAMMGSSGLTKATQVAILNANYMARRLEEHYPILYRGKNGRVAHEFIVDCRAFEESAGIKVEDIAKRLMDYGFHAPTMSWPVAGTLMIEPTESESRAELDRLCDALIAIRAEIRAIETGRSDRADNPLKNAPHTAHDICAAEWNHPYSRETAAFPAAWVRAHKYWPPVGRVDNVWGDRNLFCSCVPVETAATVSV